jgi:WD40 repeat protein
MTVELWDLSTSKDIFRQKLEANRNAVNVVRFSPDGLMLLTSCSDPSVRLWDISAMATPSPTVEGHSSWIKDLCFSPDKSFLASASNDGTVRLWGLSSTTKSAIPNRTLNTGVVSKLVFSSDGTTLQTDNGDFKLEAAENEIASAQQADSNPSTPVPSRLSLSGDWIVYNKTRLLRIPPDHLPLYAISCERGMDGDVLAFGDPTGTVSILEFNVISE